MQEIMVYLKRITTLLTVCFCYLWGFWVLNLIWVPGVHVKSEPISKTVKGGGTEIRLQYHSSLLVSHPQFLTFRMQCKCKLWQEWQQDNVCFWLLGYSHVRITSGLLSTQQQKHKLKDTTPVYKAYYLISLSHIMSLSPKSYINIINCLNLI